MRFAAAVSLVSLSLASAALAQLTPGAVVRAGAPFPVVADFDGDGLDDLIQERNVVLNDGGSFAEVRDLGLGTEEKVVGALDVNGDGILELLTVTTGAVAPPSLGGGSTGQQPAYRLYLGNPARHYAKGVEISTGARPYVADVDGDGHDDLVVLAAISQNHFNIATEATVLRSRGDGTFDRLAPFRFPADPQLLSENRILSGDLNHDGLTDLVMRCPYDLVVLLGLGGGRFSVATRYMP
ncbi:MAG TPA: VCBS repeat-containing protein, partial [Thermoanaerobaculia bacterium]|nr:VCBS repeat-containing protein [Thermoanaerobaculia bacterium]